MDNLDNSQRARRIVQVVSDLCRGSFGGKRLLDLGCAQGQYAIEFAKRGADAVGIEGRASWLELAYQGKFDNKLSNVEFIQGDVRAISRAQHGSFDVILCLGLLYHLDFEDALGLLRSMADICSDFVLIDTQISVRPDTVREHEGKCYSGWVYREHPEGATPEQKEATLGASLDDDLSFWFTKPSLLNALRHAGFTSVMECRNPVDNLYLNGELKLHEDVVTLVAMKGPDIGHYVGANPKYSHQEDWPESMEGLYLERPWTPRPVPANPETEGTTRRKAWWR